MRAPTTIKTTDEQKAVYAAEEAKREAAKIADNAAAESNAESMVGADPEAQRLIAEGGKLWYAGGRVRIYLSRDQKFAAKGWGQKGREVYDDDGDVVSHNRVFKATLPNFFYNVATKKVEE